MQKIIKIYQIYSNSMIENPKKSIYIKYFDNPDFIAGYIMLVKWDISVKFEKNYNYSLQ